jgi:hypothetical protein
MNWHDDINKAFKPLLDHLESKSIGGDFVQGTVSQYMYMGNEEDDTYYYKHFATREYVKINPTQKLMAGNLENYREWR